MYLSHFILKKVDVSVVCERWMERHIYSKRGLLLPKSSSRSQEVATLAFPCKLVRNASDRLLVPRSTVILCLCLNLNACFSSRDLLLVTHLLYSSVLIALLFTNHNVTACQSTRGHRKCMSYVIYHMKDVKDSSILRIVSFLGFLGLQSLKMKGVIF